METIKDFESILNEEEQVLKELSNKQQEVKKSVIDREWEVLVSEISQVNILSEKFRTIDLKRDELQKEITEADIKPYYEKLGSLRSLLLKCKVENRVLTDYVNIAKSFVQEVVEKAVPNARNKNYSRNGKVIQPQPQSVVLNQLF